MEIIDDSEITPEEDTMQLPDGFFDKIDEALAEKIYMAITE